MIIDDAGNVSLASLPTGEAGVSLSRDSLEQIRMIVREELYALEEAKSEQAEKHYRQFQREWEREQHRHILLSHERVEP